MLQKNILLLGYMGCGKTRVGGQLADRLEVDHIDLDTYIAEKEQKSIPEIFAEKGEIYFRKQEHLYLQKVLKSRGIVISLGGGTPCYAGNMELIREDKNSLSCYLKAGIETLGNRLFLERKSRPLIAHLPTEEALLDYVRKHLFERAFYYNQADWQLAIENKSPEQLVEELVGKVRIHSAYIGE